MLKQELSFVEYSLIFGSTIVHICGYSWFSISFG